MKATILAGAIAAFMFGTGAAAAEGDCPPGHAKVERTSAVTKTVAQAPGSDVQDDSAIQQDDSAIQQEPDDSAVQDENLGIGGSGDVGTSSQDLNKGLQQDQGLKQEEGVGGSGKQGGMLLRCEPVNQGTGGSGMVEPQDSSRELVPSTPPPAPPPQGSNIEPAPPPPSGAEATGGSGMVQPPPTSDFRPSPEAVTVVQPVEVKEKPKNDTKGLTVLLGGGVEGYTGALAPQLNPGPTAGVTASLKPTSVLGLELGYSGAVNNIDSKRTGGADLESSGPDLVRNGGQAAVTLSLSPASWQPYVLGGIGINDYNFRGGQQLGYTDDTVGNVPVGAGLRGHIGHFTADVRASYNFLFDKEFAPAIDSGGGDLSGGGSYSGTLNLGGTF